MATGRRQEPRLREASEMTTENHPSNCFCRMCRGERVRRQRRIERENPVSRTDDLRAGGASERAGSGGSGGAPFVKWGDDYGWVEGKITGTFKTKYGLAGTMMVGSVCDGGLETQGVDDEGNRFQGTVRVGANVNIGLGMATLEDKITQEDKGKSFHVAFEGWEHPQGGSRYRIFTVVELEERPQRSAEGLETVPPSDDDRQIEDTSDF